MQVTGYISSTVLEKTTKTTGKKFYAFRLAENFGSGAKRTTTWYDVLAHISEDEAKDIQSGDLVEISGKIETMPYLNKEGEPAASLRLIAFTVKKHPKE